MLQSSRNAAFLATLGVLLVALFPAGVGTYTSTHGPVTAVRVVVDHALEFTTISLLPIALIAYRELHLSQGIPMAPLAMCALTPTLALRC